MFVATVFLTAIISFGNGTPTQVYDTIIVGLGAAGCTAAAELCKSGRKVLALEAMDRVGGRVHTVAYGDGVLELGAEWIHGDQDNRVYDIAIQNNIAILPQDFAYQVFRSDGTESDKDIVNELVTFALETIEDPPEDPEPLGQFLTQRITEYVKNNHPSLLKDPDYLPSFLLFMDAVIDNIEATSSWNDVTTHSLYEELKGHHFLSWHRHGYKTFFDILLNTYNKGPGHPTLDLKLQKAVTKISYPQDPADDVLVLCEDGDTYRARNVIVTVSLGVLKDRYNTLFSPPLPQTKIDAIQQISMGVIDKIFLEFDTPWWDHRLSFYNLIWRGEDIKMVEKEDLWVTKIDSFLTTMGFNNTLLLWTTGDRAKMIETLPDDVVMIKCMTLIRSFLGKNRTIPDPVRIIRSNWHSNPYTRGSYTYDNICTPKHPNARSILAEPLLDASGALRVLFAGEATDDRHYATVSGAANTGYKEARRLMQANKDV